MKLITSQMFLSIVLMAIIVWIFFDLTDSYQIRRISQPYSSYRCFSICRRDEESLCRRCLFREPMRFGKRNYQNPEQKFSPPFSSFHLPSPPSLTPPTSLIPSRSFLTIPESIRFERSFRALNNPIPNAIFREPMRFGKRAAQFREMMRFGRSDSRILTEEFVPSSAEKISTTVGENQSIGSQQSSSKEFGSKKSIESQSLSDRCDFCSANVSSNKQ
ncbi:hypothetical protein NH340_JMT05502 [Sarcoptes scabiei]|nr:hypothetical protein NH340_JMT05502 [Sarcoptes scabiei]